jgi:MFS family permease
MAIPPYNLINIAHAQEQTMNQTASLWRNTEFIKLWVGQTISVFGSEITNLALPLTAVLLLNATPAQMGVLGALGTLPFVLVGLFAGVWADRKRRRPILMNADFGRALLLGSIPVVLLTGFMTIEYLYVVTFLIGVLTVFFRRIVPGIFAVAGRA